MSQQQHNTYMMSVRNQSVSQYLSNGIVTDTKVVNGHRWKR